MKYVALGLVLLGVFLAGRWRNPKGRSLRGLGAAWRFASGYWRLTAGLLSIILLTLALALFVREDWIVAAILALSGLAVAISARRRARRTQTRAVSGMSAADARAILGLEADASREQIQAAYLRLIRMAHPDRGGTRGLAAQLNAARETLMRQGGQV